MNHQQDGFTLLELLVVITLLGIVSGAVVLGYEGVQDRGREQMSDFQLAEIRKALLQFRRDSGSKDFSGQGIYDCALLADSVLNDGIPASWTSGVPELNTGNKTDWIDWCKHPANFWMLFIDPIGDGWNEDTRRGWNGPYIQRKNSLLANGVWGILDPYQEPFEIQGLDDDATARLVSRGSGSGDKTLYLLR